MFSHLNGPLSILRWNCKNLFQFQFKIQFSIISQVATQFRRKTLKTHFSGAKKNFFICFVCLIGSEPVTHSGWMQKETHICWTFYRRQFFFSIWHLFQVQCIVYVCVSSSSLQSFIVQFYKIKNNLFLKLLAHNISCA